MTAPVSKPGFWQRRLLAPLRAQLAQGVEPDRLAFTIAVGVVCGLLPFFGFTSLFALVVGLGLRLSQPVLQTLNQLLGPIQVMLILVYVRAGEKIWRAAPMPLSVATLVHDFNAGPRAFLLRFGWTGVHAATAWGLSAPFIFAAVYFSVRGTLRRWAGPR
jgi:hypothetical protein